MLCQGCERIVRLYLIANPRVDSRVPSRDSNTPDTANTLGDVASPHFHSSTISENASAELESSSPEEIDSSTTSLRCLLQAASHGYYMCKSYAFPFDEPEQQHQQLLDHLRNNKHTDILLTRTACIGKDDRRGRIMVVDHRGGLTIDGKSYAFFTRCIYVIRPCDATSVRPSLQTSSIYGSTGDKAVLLLLKSWLGDCLATHKLCLRSISASLPSRLIDTNANGIRDFRIIDVDATFINARYLTLSHRWGNDTPTLRQHNADRYRKGVTWKELPGLYQDVFRLVNALGYRYIWIDSLCIFQGDRLDMLNEGLTMAEVYSGAICNIVAGEAQTGRLFANRHQDIVNPFVDIFSLGTGHQSITLRLEDTQLWSREVRHSPIASRGWVLQEQLLAPRTLYFGAGEVFWDCNTGRRSEGFPSLTEVYTQSELDTGPDWGNAPSNCMIPLWSWDAPLSRFIRSANALLMGDHALKEINSGVAHDFWYVSIPSALF